jgi:hypothetical protein
VNISATIVEHVLIKDLTEEGYCITCSTYIVDRSELVNSIQLPLCMFWEIKKINSLVKQRRLASVV